MAQVLKDPPEPPGGGLFDGSLSISVREAEWLVRLLEAAPHVRRRYQFFVWLQSHVHLLVPHLVVVCGSYRRQIKELAFETFNGIPLPDCLSAQLATVGVPELGMVARLWTEQGGVPRCLTLDQLQAERDGEIWRGLRENGLSYLLVHGVSRPDRPSEIESLFVFAKDQAGFTHVQRYCLELLMPHLHAVYLRVQTTERELGNLPPRARAPAAATGGGSPLVTNRERQILFWVREGKSNQQIGEQLHISPLTVKNHIQKILRKLGASNRTQAVALASAAELFSEPLGNAGPRER